MKAGKLRHTVSVQTPLVYQDTAGATLTDWAELGVWKADIQPLTVNEQFTAEQQHASATHRLVFRYRPVLAAMTGKERTVYGTRVFVHIGLPTTVDERNREIHQLAEEGLRQE